jgi:cytochrome c peroxidase
MIRGLLPTAILLAWLVQPIAMAAEPDRSTILAHGPWPPEPAMDPSNRVSGNPDAQALGGLLFADPRLSPDGAFACTSCHLPDRAFTDGRPVAEGRKTHHRNTPTILNSGFARWYGWDGASDSLWASSIRPILDPEEMGSSAENVAALFRGDPDYGSRYREIFGTGPANDPDETILVNAGKMLAAWQAAQVTPRSAFDRYRDALAADDSAGIAAYPEPAKRGLTLFAGRGRCNLCHAGPVFTNGEFADAGVPFFIEGGVDKGRYGGIRALKDNPYNRTGIHSDDRSPAATRQTRTVRLLHRNFGEFKVPSLRNIRATAPYMHDGSLATLSDVIDHYSELDETRLHADGEKTLRALDLTAAEKADLLAFLLTL